MRIGLKKDEISARVLRQGPIRGKAALKYRGAAKYHGLTVTHPRWLLA
jgi:hypothetical protein